MAIIVNKNFEQRTLAIDDCHGGSHKCPFKTWSGTTDEWAQTMIFQH